MVPFVILTIDDPVKRARYSDAYLKHSQHLIAVAMSLLHDSSAAEDALHDTFAAIITADTLPEDWMEQKALLTTVIKHKSIDMLNRMKHLADEEPFEFQMDSADETERIELDMLIDLLPDIYKDVLIMYYENGLSAKQIAGILDVSVDTVFKRLERARKLLRKEYLEEE